MTWQGLGPGDTDPVIGTLKAALRHRYPSYASGLSAGNTYQPADEPIITEYQRRVHAEVLSGKRKPPDPRTDGRIDWATKVQVGVIARGVPAQVGPRHLGIVFRGTGGIIGADYVSRVCQAVPQVEEVNPAWPATMGGIPVAAAGSPGDPSMQDGIHTAFADAQRIFLERHEANPKIKIVVGGYSAGAVAAALFRQWLLSSFPENYLCSFSFGDPTRPFGGSYFRGPKLAGQGISSWRYGDTLDWRHCWLAHPDDMYTNVPTGVTGDIMDDCYDMITQFQLSDPLGTALAILPRIPEVAGKAGINLPDVFGAFTTGLPGILTYAAPLVIGALAGVITGAVGGGFGDPDRLTGPAAAAQAAIIALKFVTSQPPTAAHIQYELREVWPGQTYLGLAIQHVRDYALRVAPVG